MDKTAKERMKKYRNKQKEEKRNETVTELTKGVTESLKSVTPSVTPYHPILKYLVPGKKRENMVAIVQSLLNRKQLDNVSYGIGKHSLPMTMVGELLDATLSKNNQGGT